MEKMKNIDLLNPLFKQKRLASTRISKLTDSLTFLRGSTQISVVNKANSKKTADESYYYHLEKKIDKQLKSLDEKYMSPYQRELNKINIDLEKRYWQLRSEHEEFKKSIEDNDDSKQLVADHLNQIYTQLDEYKQVLSKNLLGLSQERDDLENYQNQYLTIKDTKNQALLTRIDKDHKTLLSLITKLEKYHEQILESGIRIFNKELVDELVSGHKDVILSSNDFDYSDLQDSRNSFINYNYSVLKHFQSLKKSNKVVSEIDSYQYRLEKLDEDISTIISNHQEYADNPFINMQDNQEIHLRINNLKMYFGGLKAVDNLSFDIKRGEIFSLIGPNGAGKTTVFNCITQFYKPTSGEVYLNDKYGVTKRLNDYQVHDVIKQGIARTFQNVELINELTVYENLLVGSHSNYQTNLFQQMFKVKKSRQEEQILQIRAYTILQRLSLTEYMFSYPQGLPYGILKRVELARSLMTDPEIIILDEPAAGLNESETKELSNLIRQLSREFNLTIFLVEHDMTLVMDISDRICAINFGKMLAIGKPEEIRKNPLVQEAYLGGEKDE